MKEYFGNITDENISYFLFDKLSKNQANIIFIAKDIKDENRILTNLKFYLQNNKQFKDVELLNFPSYETLFYDYTSINSEIVNNRISTLYKLLTNKQQTITIISLETILFKLPPTNFITKFNLNLKIGETIDTNKFSEELINYGYLRVSKVEAPLDFAIRGSIIDIYPTGAKNPFRVDLFANEINEIRIFDIENQKSIKKIKSFNILNAKEFDFNKIARNRFLTNHKNILGKNDLIYEKVKNAIIPTGIELYLSLFFEEMNSFFDFISPNSLAFS